MDSINCTVLNRDLAKEFGKKENDSDLEFYHRAFNEKHLTFVCPAGFPEKPGALLQALFLSDTVLLYIDKIDASLGEAILAIDAMGIEKGFVALDPVVDEGLFWKICENTCVKGFEKIEKDEALEKVSSVEPTKIEGETVVDLDAMFQVKGVGVVALGFVTQGGIEKFQKLNALPLKSEVLVKSIQKQDKVFDTAEFGERVGLAIKGLDADDFSRGMLLTSDKGFGAGNEFGLVFEKNSYCKNEIVEGMQLHLQCRMQITGCKVKSINPLIIETGKSIAARAGEKVTLIDINAKPRIIGKGEVTKTVGD